MVESSAPMRDMVCSTSNRLDARRITYESWVWSINLGIIPIPSRATHTRRRRGQETPHAYVSLNPKPWILAFPGSITLFGGSDHFADAPAWKLLTFACMEWRVVFQDSRKEEHALFGTPSLVALLIYPFCRRFGWRESRAHGNIQKLYPT